MKSTVKKWPTMQWMRDAMRDMYAGQASEADGNERRRCFAALGISNMRRDELRRYWLETNGATAEEMGYR